MSNDIDNAKILSIIVAARKIAGLTQKQLAKQIGVSSESVAKWEEHRKLPGGHTLVKIINLLGIYNEIFPEAKRYDANIVLYFLRKNFPEKNIEYDVVVELEGQLYIEFGEHKIFPEWLKVKENSLVVRGSNFIAHVAYHGIKTIEIRKKL